MDIKDANRETLAAAQPAPTASDHHPPVLELLIETLRTRSAAGALKYGTLLKPFNGRDALIDLLQELADGCMYVMQAIAERDAVAQRCHNCNSTMVQCAGCEFSGTWDRSLSPRPERDDDAKQVETLTKERDAYKAQWELCEATSQKQDEALAAAGLAMDHLAKERDLAAADVARLHRAYDAELQEHGRTADRANQWAKRAAEWEQEALRIASARSELDLCTGRLQTAVDEVAELRDLLAAEKQQVEEWRFTAANREKVTAMATGAFMNAQQETELLRASLAATQAELERARRTTDESLPSAGPPCPHSKAKQVGSSSFVVRRCKLADGHEGMCEPA